MLCTTAPVLVLGYGRWEHDDGSPMTNKAGEMIEWVQILDQENSEVIKMTMRGVNGDRPKELSPAEVMIKFAVDRKGGLAKGKDGNDYEVIRERLKPTCVGFKSVGRAPAPAAQASAPAKS